MGLKIEIISDNSQEITNASKDQIKMGLWAVGSTAEGYAKDKCPVDTGRLRNSITFATPDFGGIPEYTDSEGKIFTDGSSLSKPKDNTVHVGTNVKYAVFVEEMDSKHHNVGSAHFLRNSISDHIKEYKDMLIGALKK